MIREAGLRIFLWGSVEEMKFLVADNQKRLERMFCSLWRRISPGLPDARRRLLTQGVVQQRRAAHAAANRDFHG
jgi:hypothetical protein